MMIMKKLAILTMCLMILVAAIFAGCGTKDAAEDTADAGDEAGWDAADTADAVEDTADDAADDAGISSLNESAYTAKEESSGASAQGVTVEDAADSADDGLFFGDDSAEYDYPDPN